MTSYHYTELVQSSYLSTANELINGARRGRLINRRHFKERGVYSHDCNKLNKTKMLSVKMKESVKTKNIQSINVPTSMSESSLKSYCVTIVTGSLSLSRN